MYEGFVRVAACSPEIRVADTAFNASGIIGAVRLAQEQAVQLLALPEMALTGYTAGDLFFQDALHAGVEAAVREILAQTADTQTVFTFTVPLCLRGRMYNAALVMQAGRILGAVPKMNLPGYGEFYEPRQFCPGFETPVEMEWCGQRFPFGANLLFEAENRPACAFAVEICEDLWAPLPPSISHALAGALIILNPSASDELVGKADYRRALISSHSARLVCAYAYADAGPGESTQDMVFSAHNLISENGAVLAESDRYEEDWVIRDVDLDFLAFERRRMNTFRAEAAPHETVRFTLANLEKKTLERFVDPAPFVPGDAREREKRCEDILNIQAHGLAKRLRHVRASSAVIGLSGGLDSTLALLVTVRAFDLLGLNRKGVLAVTMPCFGTTRRTRGNAEKLADGCGVTLKTVEIAAAVTQHFADIGQPMDRYDVTFENGQARERTQVLMDLANMTGGLVIGTGDLSESALGWATYNGDHMSMYAVNVSIPKTLVRYLVDYVASRDETIADVLRDILATPVSPELLPPKDGEIAQKTEAVVGPYELHDFFLYHLVRRGSAPERIYEIARVAFSGRYDDETIRSWLRIFMRRFFAQQYKRSCIPDGPKVGSVSLSPRADWRMPSDASGALWRVQ